MRPTHNYSIRPHVLATFLLAAVAVLLASCGGSSSGGGVAHISSSTGASTSTGGAPEGSGQGSLEAQALTFARCMRSSGVPNFPDPKGGGFLFQRGAGVDPSSPAFEAAQAKCKKFLPPGPGSGPPPSAKTLAHFLRIAQCMRRNGVPGFPDPRTSVPSNPRAALGSGGGVISDIEGVILVFPGTIDERSPAFMRAATTCQFPLHNH